MNLHPEHIRKDLAEAERILLEVEGGILPGRAKTKHMIEVQYILQGIIDNFDLRGLKIVNDQGVSFGTVLAVERRGMTFYLVLDGIEDEARPFTLLNHVVRGALYLQHHEAEPAPKGLRTTALLNTVRALKRAPYVDPASWPLAA
jgi:hypothetical protein